MTSVENRKDYEIGRVNVTDRDDRGTGNWEAKYFISNDPHGNFAINTDPDTNQGVLTVVKVQLADLLLDICCSSHTDKPMWMRREINAISIVPHPSFTMHFSFIFTSICLVFFTRQTFQEF